MPESNVSQFVPHPHARKDPLFPQASRPVELREFLLTEASVFERVAAATRLIDGLMKESASCRAFMAFTQRELLSFCQVHGLSERDVIVSKRLIAQLVENEDLKEAQYAPEFWGKEHDTLTKATSGLKLHELLNATREHRSPML